MCWFLFHLSSWKHIHKRPLCPVKKNRHFNQKRCSWPFNCCNNYFFTAQNNHYCRFAGQIALASQYPITETLIITNLKPPVAFASNMKLPYIQPAARLIAQSLLLCFFSINYKPVQRLLPHSLFLRQTHLLLYIGLAGKGSILFQNPQYLFVGIF